MMSNRNNELDLENQELKEEIQKVINEAASNLEKKEQEIKMLTERLYEVMEQKEAPKNVMINISGDSLESSFQQVITIPGQLQHHIPDHPLYGQGMTPNSNRLQRDLHRQNRNNNNLEIENLLSSQI